MSGKWRDYYRILGVRPDATQDEIKEAWLFGVKAFHPDKFAGSSQRQQAVSQERTKAVNEAYYILSDTIRRANYDREYARNTGAESTSPSPPRSAPPPEPPKTASSTDSGPPKDQASSGSPGEQNLNEPLSTVLYGAGPYIAWLIAAAMLVSAAVERHPYSFYMLLRWVCCAIFAYSAFAAHEKNRLLWVWVFGALAALYNPIFLVHLDRGTWIGVNWFTVGVIIVGAVAFLPRRAQIWIGAAAALVVIIAGLLWGVSRVSLTSVSRASPQVIESAPVTLEFSPEPSSTDPNFGLTPIPRAIPVAPAANTPAPTLDSQSGNVFDQFDVAPTGAKTYRITGTVLEVTDTMIAVQKGTDRWEINRDAKTKVSGDLKVGEEVTITYRISATAVR